MSSGWAVDVYNAAAAAVLINAGVAKLVVPGPLRRASAEVFRMPVGDAFVRAFGAIEVAAAVALLAGPARWAAVIAAVLLGAGFAIAGLAGVLRRSRVPCGCFGGVSRQPLGWANVALGLALAAAWPVNALGTGPGYSPRPVLLASIASIVACLWLNRRLITPLLSAIRSPQPEAS